MVDAVVADRVVEPYVCLALYLVVYPGHVALVYHIYDAVAGPHYVYVLVHDVAKSGKVNGIRPSTVVLGGANYAGVHVGICLFEFRCNVVHKFSLFVTV